MERKKKEKKPVEFTTYDIETSRNGELLCAGLYDPFDDDVKHFYKWDDFFNFLRLNNHHEHFRNLFAHNAGNFDVVHFLYWMLKCNDKFDGDNLQIIMSGSTVIFFQYTEFEYPITFGDSVLTLKKSLKDLCAVFQPKDFKKETFPIQMITQVFTYDHDLFLEYLDCDCKSLYQIMGLFMGKLNITSFPLTIASLAKTIFYEKYLNKDITLIKPTPKQDRKFLAHTYAGGRVECFQPGIHDQVYSFDINSLYPYIMSFAEIPINETPVRTMTYDENCCGFYQVEFTQTNKDCPAVLWRRTPFEGLRFVYEGVGFFYVKEIELMLSVGGSIKVLDGITFPETAIIFDSFVDKHYTDRLIYKNIEKETGIKQPMQLILKWIMNNLYGKFAQKELSEHLEIMDGWKREQYLEAVELDELGQPVMYDQYNVEGEQIFFTNGDKVQSPRHLNSVNIYDESCGLMTVKTEKKINHRMVQISSIITSLARVELYKYLDKYKDIVIYCDTDSVHLTENICMNQGEKLGQMKKENCGRGVYLGRKMYAIYNDELDDKYKYKKKYKYKGITNGSKLGGNKLTFENFGEIWEQSQEVEQEKEKCYQFKFNTFPKLKKCLKGLSKPAKIVTITKALKKAEYFTNFKRG